MTTFTTHRPTLTAVAQATLALLCACTAQAHAQTQSTPAPAADKALPSVTVNATPESGETATGPVTGFVATRALSATKTDTPLLETPQAISVITRDEMEAQGAQTLRQATAYTTGVVSNYFDSRQDTFSARGNDLSQYLDGLLRQTGYWNDTRPDPYTLERVEVLRGPSSVLYGKGTVGGVLALTTKKPLAETQREVQIELGSHSRKQIAADLTGAIDKDGEWLYRLVAVGRDSDTQVDYVKDDRVVIAPSLTWKPNAATSLTLQATHQRDKSGSLIGFFPWQGTVLPNTYGQIPTSRFNGEPGWDAYNASSDAIGYQFSHQLSDAWTLRQNLRRTVSDVDYRTLWTSFSPRPVFTADNRTVQRDANWHLGNVRMLLVDTQLQGKQQWGSTEHNLLMGMDVQRVRSGVSDWYQTDAADLDLYNPVYGNFTPPTAADLTQHPGVSERQLGFYAQDQIRWNAWTFTLGLRHDKARSATDGSPEAASEDKAWSKRAGATYQLGNGWAPYVSYAESFLPLGGVDFYGKPYKPTRGKQWEAGVKWQPPGQGISAYAAAYQLRETNRKTTDPANPMNSLQVGEAKVRGLEAEVKASLARHWDVSLGYAYTDARISRSNDGDQGQRLESVPKHTASAWLSHRFAAEGRGGWTVGAGVRYTGSQSSSSGSYAIGTPAATIADAMLGYDAGDWRVAFNVVNLTDKVQITQCLARGDCFYGQARTYTLTSTYRF
ncbi:TonB-dependent siderophore receptor [Acidovorax sp. 106]|uniref:TonB-dependent siderophore receptor n=1 Tax=Acidovorax sp. 106 TaxID=2135637 RepID=UPI000EB0110B|nr:TonB-dependent siderophore receptor [Acidovorax sp. 106]RLJ36770.1 iron complex outermembrane receptor protein [Acidovorax sp. 106]